jgi:hypothetical protein
LTCAAKEKAFEAAALLQGKKNLNQEVEAKKEGAVKHDGRGIWGIMMMNKRNCIMGSDI